MCILQVKVSHESSLNRSCAMCVNYEKQLQKMQDENQKFQNLASNLQVALDQEKVQSLPNVKKMPINLIKNVLQVVIILAVLLELN